MSRIILLIVTLIASIIVPISLSAACDPTIDAPAWQFLRDCATGVTNSVPVTWAQDKAGIKELIVSVSRTILQFGALFAIGAIVYAGIRYTTSGGDEEKLKWAKNTVIYAAIGLILILTAFPLVNLIVEFIYSFGS